MIWHAKKPRSVYSIYVVGEPWSQVIVIVQVNDVCLLLAEICGYYLTVAGHLRLPIDNGRTLWLLS